MKKLAITILKIILPIVVIVWLCVQVQKNDPETFLRLWTSEKRWDLLALSIALVFAAVTISFVRWHLLIRAMGLPLRLRDTLRLGFLGYLMNFVAPGQVGGDLFKAVFIARDQKGRRAAAIATIFVDRICGLYGLLLVTSVGLFLSGLGSTSYEIRLIEQSTYLFTILGAIGIVILLTPGMTNSRMARFATNIPKIGGLFKKLFDSIDLLRSQKQVFVYVGILSVSVHLLLAVGVYVSARAIFSDVPSLGQHLVISPVANVVGAIPLTPGGLGSYELATTFLYDLLSSDANRGRGVIIGLVYRFSTIAVAAVGLIFYWTHRAEFSQVMKRASEEASEAAQPSEQLSYDSV